MAPFLTRRGKAALAVALLWLIVAGALLTSGRPSAAWPMLVGSGATLLLLAVGFFGAVPIARVLDSALFDVELEAPEGEAALRTDTPILPRLRVINRSGLKLRALRARPELSTALEEDAERLPKIELDAAARAEIDVPLVARRSGRWFVHGFHVACHDALRLFCARNYVAAPLPLTILPSGLLDRRSSQLTPAQPMLHERIGVHEVRQRGFGTDLREIRDHQHGDPFKNIAWKATARTGSLMVREFEAEIALNAYLVVDISATMRGSIERGGKLEHAIRLATNFARAILRGNDRCGVITFDEKVYGHLPPREGRAHLMRIAQHLIGTSSVVDETLTEYDEDEAIQTLIRYLMLQRRLDFRRREPIRRKSRKPPAVEDTYDVELLNRWLRKELSRKAVDEHSLRVGVVGYDELSLVRRFCHLHGVEIPYRSELRYGTKEQGLVEAIETIMEASRNPHLMLIVSDLAGIVDMDRVKRVLRLARHRRHKVAVLAPFTPRYVPVPEDEDAARLHEIFSAAESRERRSVLAALRDANVQVMEIGPQDTIGGLLRRVQLFR